MEPVLPGLSPSPAVLIDERGRPDFRDVFGALAARSVDVATAITRVRLSTVDLTAEMDRLEHFRVVVAELNALQLDAEARAIHADPRRAPRVDVLLEMLESGRLDSPEHGRRRQRRHDHDGLGPARTR